MLVAAREGRNGGRYLDFRSEFDEAEAVLAGTPR